ncbi:hypothetical protein LUZ62_072747 [Rhynchospora pubera]|uniref:protein-serine/threonine phosphatase n=1 Tax=Rhynchospora pubera TaxID=906938 RepID=A0AAV8D6V7_9POAL|nr:hypothetical protein LUZ62_072747 [Rhynchospora pubera]
MVAVASGARRPGSHRRRASPLTRNRPANKSKHQQVIPRSSSTEPLLDSRSDEGSNCTMAALECILGLARVLGMGSCLLSADERRGSNGSSSPTSPGRRVKRGSKKRPGSRSSSVEGLRGIPDRLAGSGSSLSGAGCMFTQQGKKGVNQDAMLIWENFGPRSDTTFCGVFDGHGPFGHLVAKRVRDHLPLKLNSHMATEDIYDNASSSALNNIASEEIPLSKDSGSDKEEERSADFYAAMKESFLKAFKVMDKDLRLHGNVDCFFSGTTAVTIVKQGKDLVIGNLGDSRAILGTRDSNNRLMPVQLTVDLKPNVPREAERIRKCKGRVFALRDEPEVARVWLPNYDTPGLAMARAFGDFCLKGFGLISEPEVSYRRLTERDEFVVLATDGVWDVLSNKEVVDIVAAAPTRSSAARSLVESAVRSWRLKYPTSKIDDCAVVCLFLDTDSVAEAGTSMDFERSESEYDIPDDDGSTMGTEEEKLVPRADTLFSLPKYVSGVKPVTSTKKSS